MPDALWFSLPNSSPSHSVQAGLSVSLDSLNDNHTSVWGAQSGQIDSRLLATWKHVAYGNADVATSATAGTPMLWRWIKASMSAIGCDYMPPAHIIIICSICCALQHIYLSSLSHLLFSLLCYKSSAQ